VDLGKEEMGETRLAQLNGARNTLIHTLLLPTIRRFSTRVIFITSAVRPYNTTLYFFVNSKINRY
jgi:hypothetical protein